MLVWADHLEEQGDIGSAEALRGLAGTGVPSLVAMAGTACLVSVPLWPDGNDHDSGDGFNLPEEIWTFDEDYCCDMRPDGSSSGEGNADYFESDSECDTFGDGQAEART